MAQETRSTGIIVQARLGSTRLPAKVMRRFGGRSILAHVLLRCRAVECVETVVVATTDQSEDDVVASEASELGFSVFRGSSKDVLSRYVGAARAHMIDDIVRITADCPLLDPLVVDRAIKRYREGECDLVHTGESYPEGMGVEVLSLELLELASLEARVPSEREHVTSFAWSRPDRFKICPIEHEPDLSAIRLTVDHEVDLRVVEKVYTMLSSTSPVFGLADIKRLYDRRPELFEPNQHIIRREGYQKSLVKDKKQGEVM